MRDGKLVPGDLLIDPISGERREVVWVKSGSEITTEWPTRMLPQSATATCAARGISPSRERATAEAAHRRFLKLGTRGLGYHGH
jgi:hypothetical protein